jgi:FkbM family methyltransferase
MADVTSPFGTYSLNSRERQFLRWAQGMPVGWLGRRAALILRKTVLVKDHVIVDAIVDGLKMRLYMQDNVSERKYLFMPQFFDRAERGLLRQRLKPGDVFVDIGANAGIYSLTAAALVGEEGHVLSVEPNPVVLDRLKFNMALNGFERRTLIEQSCVSDSEGAVDLALDDTNLGGSSLVEARSEKTIRVAAYPLIGILGKYQLEKIDALKIDIEGAEDRALIPFFRDAPEGLHPKLLIVENSAGQWQGDLKGALRKAGYRLAETTRMNLIFEK